ncbi:MAG: hypothetical protein Edafosvirus26_9 [Edafosvirus sp.]|uniref:Uncharacterized protein n=1 Tax=Edafosvirus sp. TaxID=2487765 RepID=A0A3G4ZUX0_9VIRU|nr:MAG: hypothetical protein Edafosvirus26_9 [Edafosvirus sp.]
MVFNNLAKDLLVFIVWVAIWQLLDNIISKHVRWDDYDKRILIYGILFIVSYGMLEIFYDDYQIN